MPDNSGPDSSGLQPVVTLALDGRSIEVSWPAVAGVFSYHVEVADGSGTVVHTTNVPAAGYSPPVTLDFTPAEGATYTVEVHVVGPDSSPVQITIPSGSSILRDLNDRLMAARVQSQASAGVFVYPLDDVVLPATGAGEEAAVRSALETALAVPAGTLTVTCPAGPVLTADSVTLTGTSDAVTGDATSQVTLVFTVSDALALQATWTTVPADWWDLTDSFENLDWTPYQYLPISGAVFAATTFVHQDHGFFFELRPGLQFQATLAIRSDLLPADATPGDATGPTVQHVRVGGPISCGADRRPAFTWTGESALGPLSIARIGQDPLTMTGGTLALSSTPSSDPNANDNVLTVTGPVALGPGATTTCTLDLPSSALGSINLRAADPALSSADANAALAELGVADILSLAMPASLLAMAGAEVTKYSVQFTPDGTDPTRTEITLAFATGAWSLVPSLNLAISDLAVTVYVTRGIGYGADPKVNFGAQVTGRISLGDAAYTVQAGLPPTGAWYVVLTGGTSGLTLATLVQLAGLTADQVTGVLPESLVTLGTSFALSQVGLFADPGTGELEQIDFTIAQTAPWHLAGDLLTVTGWTIDMSIALGGPAPVTAGVLDGNIALTAGGQTTTLTMNLPIPIGEGAIWTLGLAPGTAIQLPSIGQVLGLFGATALPAGVDDLGGLDLTRFTVAFDPAAATLTGVSLAFGQTADSWTIIQNALSVTQASMALAFDPTSTPVGVLGTIGGIVVLCGSPVDVSAVKNTWTEGWSLLMAFESPVHAPGFSALDGWLAPSESAAALPGTLPLTDGFEVGDVFLDFAPDATGALTRFGFAVHVDDLWTIIPGYLSITQVDGRLEMPYPVTADAVIGTVAGIVTIADVGIAIRATKPAQGAAWEFTGSLLDGLEIDLAAAVKDLTALTLVLPPDAITFGLPATVDIETAQVRAVPDTGAFHFTGSAGFDWQFPLGPATMSITSIGGTIDVPDRNTPLAAEITGTFDYAGVHTVVSLAFGGLAAQTVLTGTLTDASAVQISELADGIGAPTQTDTWDAVVPGDMIRLEFSGAALYLNLTTSQFMLYGVIGYAGSPAADGFVFLAPSAAGPPGTDTPWTYAVALSVGSGFRFGALFGQLSAVDDAVRVTAVHLVVCDLPGMPLSDLATTTTTLLGSIAPDTPAPLAGLTSQTLALSSGVSFTAQIDFEPATLFSHILQIGSDAEPPTVWLSALIDHTDSRDTVFAADLPDITILDTIRLTRTDAHPGIHLQYTPNQADRFELAGRMELAGIFGAGYRFDITLTADDAGMTAALRQTSQQITEPFGVPGIVLSDLTLGVAYTWAVPAQAGRPAVPQRSSFSMSGHVLMGPVPAAGQTDQRFSCTAELDLVSGTPALFAVQLDRDFSIGAFIAQCVTGAGSDWPSDFIEITFNSDTRIYYYSMPDDPAATLAVAPDGYRYVDGFNVDARITLTLVASVSLHGVITVLRDPAGRDYTGVRAGIQLDAPLDLVFVSLTGQDQPAAGPLMAFQTGPAARFVLSAGVGFFGAPFANFDVGVAQGTDGGTVFTGQLEATAELEPFGRLSCGFSYTTHPGRDGEFAIDGWPDFQWARDIIDFVQAIKDLADGSACGVFAEFIVANAYSTDFALSPSVSAAGNDLVFALTGTYSMKLTGASEPFASLTFPPLSVHVPKTTQWADVPEVLATGIAAASATFARDLLGRPDDIAMFLAMTCGPSAAKVALELVCNSLVDSAVAAAAGAAADAIADAVAAGTSVLASSIVTTAADAITQSLADSGGGDDGGGGGDDGGGGGGSTGVGTPHLRAVSYASGEITGNWDAAQGASAYTLAVAAPDGTQLAAQDVGMALTGSVQLDPAALPAATYLAEVKGTRGSQSGGWGSLPLIRLPAPVVRLSYADPQLLADWTAPSGPAPGSYTVEFYDPAGTQLGVTTTVPGGITQAGIPLPDPVPGAYSVAVRAQLTGQFPGVWSDRIPLTVLSVAAPVITAVTQSAGTVTADWAAEPAGASAEVQLMLSGDLVATATTGTATASLTPDAEIPSGAVCTVRVRLHTGAAVSPWATRDLMVWTVPAPASAILADDAGTLLASWTPVTVDGAPAPTYDVVLTDLAAPGAPVGSLTGIVETEHVIGRSDGAPSAAQDRYTIGVRAVIGDNIGPATVSAPLDAVTLDPPSAVLLSAAGTALTLSWTPATLAAPLTGPVSYAAVLTTGPAGTGTDAGQASGIGDVETALTRQDGQPVVSGESYGARIRATVPLHTSAWAEAPPVLIMYEPAVTESTYRSGLLTVAWSITELPTGQARVVYDVQALLGGEVAVTATIRPGADPAGGPAAATATLDMSGRPFGDYLVQVRALVPGPDGGLDAGASIGAWSAAVIAPVVDPPAGLRLGYDGTQLTANWDPVPGATGYTAELHGPAGQIATSQVTMPVSGGPPPPTAVFPAAGLVRGFGYTVTVAAQVDSAGSAPSEAATIVLADPPDGLIVHCDGVQITGSWSPAPGATGYELRLTEPGGALGDTVSVGGDPVPLDASLAVTGLNRGVEYAATVATVSGAARSVPSAAVPVVVLDPPSGVTAAYAAGEITVGWAPQPGVTEYTVAVAAGVTVDATLTPGAPGQPPPSTATLSASGLPRGDVCTVTVTAIAGTATAVPAAPVTILPVDPPAAVSVTPSAAGIEVSWTALPVATGYTVELRDTAGTLLTSAAVTQVTAGTTDRALLPATGLTHGVTYRVTVATVVGAVTSAASAPIDVVLPIQAPAGVTATFSDGAFAVSWQSVPDAVEYVVAVYESGGALAGSAHVHPTAPDQSVPDSATVIVSALRPATTYTVTVATLTAVGASPPSSPVPVLVPEGTPSGVSATYTGSEIDVSWRPEPGATAYRLDLHNATGTAAAALSVMVPASASTPNAATLPIAELAAGGEYEVTVTALAGQVASTPSAPVTVVLADPPTGLTLSYDGQYIEATWTAAAGATAYTLTFTAQGAPSPTTTMQIGATSAGTPVTRVDVLATGMTRGLHYTAEMTADVGAVTSRPSAPADIVLVDPPTNVAAVYTDIGIAVNWVAAAGAAGYLLRLTATGATPPFTETTNLPGSSYQGVLGTLLTVAGGVYAVTVTTQAGGFVSAPSAPVTVALANAPTGLTAEYDSTNLVFSWNPAPGATGYLYTLTTASGQVITRVTTGGSRATWPAAGLTPGAIYLVTVATQISTGPTTGTFTSRPSAATQVVVIDPPTGLTAAFDGTNIVASWTAAPGATSYAAVLHDQSGGSARSATVTATGVSFPAAGLASGVAYSLTVASQAGAATSQPAAVPVVIIASAPTNVTASYDGTQVTASWAAVQGAQTYWVQIIDPAGRVVATLTTTTAAIGYGGPEVVPGVTYSVRVKAAGYATAPWGGPATAVQNGYTCMCLGTTPGAGCGNNGNPGGFTEIDLKVSQQRLNTGYYPTRTAQRTGWVAVPPGKTGQVAALGLLVGELASLGFLTVAEAFAVFGPAAQVQVMGGGTAICMCVGTTPGNACGNGGLALPFNAMMTAVPQSWVDTHLKPTQATPRTGWVEITDDDFAPLEVMLQLVTLLAPKLGSTLPWDVFNKSMSVPIGTGSGGTTTCFGLGNPVGTAPTTMNGRYGQVVVNVSATEINGYDIGQRSGWVAIGQDDYALPAALVRLVGVLGQKGILSGTQPYDVFNNARARTVH